MAPVLSPRKLDGKEPNMDALGFTYIAIALIYTVILSGELLLLYQRRSEFCVRIRHLPVVFAAVSILHVYLVIVLLVYPWNGLFPCVAEFWIMSVFLPCGFALFQSCNAKVLTTYESQRRLTRNFLEGARKKRLSYTPQGLYEAWRNLDASTKVHVATVIGLVVSFVPAIILFFGSRRFHPSYGFSSMQLDSNACRRGGEWIPSILVQLFWTAIVGPWILWKVRHIKDVHSWAWQTRLAIVAGLPGTPMWVAFTFFRVPASLTINDYFAPAGWFIPSLIICQQTLVLAPIIEVFKSQRRQRPTSPSSETEPLTSRTSYTSEKSVKELFASKELKTKTSMQALEYSIEHSIEPLITWAATKEFTAENTIFLREVRNYKRKWSDLEAMNSVQRRQMFDEASLIYFTLVNVFTAEVPINIEYKVCKTLQDVFAGVEYDPYMPGSATPDDTKAPSIRDNVVCPWEDTLSRPASISSVTTESNKSSDVGVVPVEFDVYIFDAAYESIKYLVFTNTWPRYVDGGLYGEDL
ncbi:hypothetical protein P153DRAFT_379403 [Dothidotthia symphoricarpi CBS 119687]|uniref:RGS domain-containing protein n=1 Tax=Dothidotthia symphoricarpi CBS 119687 TaxID=1392245 RepID=A0A6A6A253_9PLEO|nr:uncharacterized protein P153DRAFT_379403 [Dothidotthia symphoricarpi CBS 119687]KAF2124818.1 hypothetical protein P153DRAFT_379403 [Dothidotthia symphoricarpi CBS 119687]